MTISPPSAMRGVQEPRVLSVPPALTSSGQEAVELAEQAGLTLDPWQQLALEYALREKPDGKWSAFEVGILVSRQNGKGGIIEARELAGLFLFHEKLIIHSAHLFDTSLEAFRRLRQLIEETPDLDRKVKRINEAHGKEGIELLNGNRIRFRARTRGGGRGFSGDVVILDEAMILPEESVGALLPTMSARPNSQLWYLGSAVDEEIHEHGRAFTRVRNRALTGSDPSLCWIEHSANDARGQHGQLLIDPADPRVVAQANPAVGFRISLMHVANERRAMTMRQYEVERLGIGYWPETEDVETKPPIDPAKWAKLVDKNPELVDTPGALAVDMDPELRWCSIAVARVKADGTVHVEVGYHEKPSPALVPYLVALVSRWNPVAIVIDNKGSAAYLRPLLKAKGIEAADMTASSVAQACVGMQRAVDDGEVTTTGDPLLLDAVKGAKKRKIGDGWGFDRKGDSTISPLVASTYARHALDTYGLDYKPPPAAPDYDSEPESDGAPYEDMMSARF
nr:terminase [Rhodococcus sp. 06-621-2]